MAEKCFPTLQELRGFGIDADVWRKFINGEIDEVNLNRNGVDVETLLTWKEQVMEIARQAANMQTYLTKAEMEAAGPQHKGTVAQVTNDPDPGNNGMWVSDGTQWIWSGIQPATRGDINELLKQTHEDTVLIGGESRVVAEVQADVDGRVTYLRELDGPMYRAGPKGLVRMLDTDDIDIAAVPVALIPSISGEVLSVDVDADGRAQAATTPRGTYSATDEGLVRPQGGDAASFDLVVYGANLSGLCAAIAARRAGRTVCILEPTSFVGGVIAAGLAFQDFASPTAFNNDVLRGISREIYSMFAPMNLRRALEAGETNQTTLNAFRGGPQNRLYPGEFRAVYERLANQYGIQIRLDVRIDAARHVWKNGKRITGIVTPAGVVRGRYFIDASYEGDLIKHSGAGYRYGRESESEYGEQGAGFRLNNARTVTGFSTNTYYPVGPKPDTPHGGADDGVMGYCFRGVMTQEANRLPWPKPDGYDRAMFVHLAEQIVEYSETAFVGNVPTIDSGSGGRVQAYDLRMQTRVNWNSTPWLGLDLIGRSKFYRDGSWAARDSFAAELALWDQGIFYFLANDSAVPQEIRDKANSWGLPADEFQDSPFGAGWPHWLYPRATIRLRGAETLTGVHQLNQQTWPTRVASFTYKQDSKACHAWAHPTIAGAVQEEGYITSPDVPGPYEIPAEVMFEAEGGIENLLVSNLISCTNVAWTAFRLEPALGMMGQAAALLAAQCMEQGDKPVQNYDYVDLKAKLNAGGFNW
ncbi:FAD-dependent oxidoreductase [Alcaligenes faecalis]|uniref:FAD-dependent oxidoreductase n=1 Tax=Alcaligenes faecalis TaxID=511 RepID=UPI0018EF2932|nr:FAD-dependent oxidoreductase [Alcaligenes faecalis]